PNHPHPQAGCLGLLEEDGCPFGGTRRGREEANNICSPQTDASTDQTCTNYQHLVHTHTGTHTHTHTHIYCGSLALQGQTVGTQTGKEQSETGVAVNRIYCTN